MNPENLKYTNKDNEKELQLLQLHTKTFIPFLPTKCRIVSQEVDISRECRRMQNIQARPFSYFCNGYGVTAL